MLDLTRQFFEMLCKFDLFVFRWHLLKDQYLSRLKHTVHHEAHKHPHTQ